MTADELKKLVALPESDVLEFKSRCPQPEQLATVISAFANTRGGTILLGIGDNGEIEGIDDPSTAIKYVERAIEAVSPPVSVETDRVVLDSKEVMALRGFMWSRTRKCIILGRIVF